jgi:hypothetical protein
VWLTFHGDGWHFDSCLTYCTLGWTLRAEGGSEGGDRFLYSRESLESDDNIVVRGRSQCMTWGVFILP